MKFPTAIDLFCGAGGLTLGLRQAGFRVIGAVDNNPLAIQTFEANHPDVTVWNQDIRKLDAQSVRRKLHIKKGELDLLAGCPPCQGFSTLRTLNGGRRVRTVNQNFVFEFLRFAKDLLPRTVMLENVPGLAEDPRLLMFCAELARLGYESEFRISDAANYGVAQRRRRVILLASRLGSLSFGRRSRPILFSEERHRGIASTGSERRSVSRLDRTPQQTHNSNLIRRIPRNGGSRTDLTTRYQLQCHQKCNGFKDIYGRMSWDVIAPTITSGCFNPSKGRFLHPSQNRAITIREAAMLQGFPRSYFFPAKLENAKLRV